MERHAFLQAQEWLQAVDNGLGPAASGGSTQALACTAWVGTASLHLSLLEQYGSSPEQYQGVLAADAQHLAFLALPGSGLDPAQLQLLVQLSMQQHPDPQRQNLRITLVLDGRAFHLQLRQLARLVMPPHVLAKLSPACQQAGKAVLAMSAPAGMLHLTLVYPHACLNLYPSGATATAAAHIPDEHEPAQLARLAQLIIDCWQQELLIGEADRSAACSRTDWQQGHATWATSLQATSAATQQLAGHPSWEATQKACSQLAQAGQEIVCKQAAAQLDLPRLLQELRQAQQQLAAAVSQRPGSNKAASHAAAAAYDRVLAAQAAAVACSLLAGQVG